MACIHLYTVLGQAWLRSDGNWREWCPSGVGGTQCYVGGTWVHSYVCVYFSSDTCKTCANHCAVNSTPKGKCYPKLLSLVYREPGHRQSPEHRCFSRAVLSATASSMREAAPHGCGRRPPNPCCCPRGAERQGRQAAPRASLSTGSQRQKGIFLTF